MRVFDIYDENCRNWVLKNFSFDKKSFLSKFLIEFDFLKGYHATKIYQFDDFSKGLFPCNKELLTHRAIALFSGIDKTSPEIIRETVDKYQPSHLHQLHFMISKKKFSQSYHYHYFGAENLFDIATALSKITGSANYKKVLIDSGKAVTIHFKIEINSLRDHTLDEFYDCLSNYEINQIHKKIVLESFIYWDIIKNENILYLEEVEQPINYMGIPEY